MILYFADRFCNVVYTVSTQSSYRQLITADETTITLESGAKTLEVTLANSKEIRDVSRPGMLVMQQNADGDNELYTIIQTEFDDSSDSIQIYCEDAGFDLLNTSLASWSADKDKTIEECLEKVLGVGYSGWAIEFNVQAKSKKLKKDALQFSTDETRFSRLKSIISGFGYEFYFSYNIEGLSVIERIINIVEANTNMPATHTFTYGVELTKIKEKGTIENLATAYTLYGVNAKGAKKQLTDLTGYKTSFSNGVIAPDNYEIFSTKRTHSYRVLGNNVICVEGAEKWGSLFDTTGTLTRVKETAYKSAVEAIEYAMRELDKVVDGEWTYDIEFAGIQNGVRVGDYIRIVDERDELYLQSRIVSIKRSEINNSFSVEISDTKKVDSEKPEGTSLLDVDVWSMTLNSSNGLVMNADTFTTQITVTLYRNGATITSPSSLPSGYTLTWYETKNGVRTKLESTDTRIKNEGFTLESVSTDDITYDCELGGPE